MAQRQGTLIHISTRVFRVFTKLIDFCFNTFYLDVEEIHGVHLSRGPHGPYGPYGKFGFNNSLYDI